MENQEQQRILEESLAAGAELKEKCMVEQQELSRLKQIWSDTQPELFPTFASELAQGYSQCSFSWPVLALVSHSADRPSINGLA